MSAIAPEPASFRQRLFFVIMACAVIVTVFAGFAPTFYLRGSFTQTRPMSVLLHVHGIVFSAWISFFLVQTLLIVRGSRRLHQRLGWVGAAIAAAMVALVTAAVIEQLHRVNGFPPPPPSLGPKRVRHRRIRRIGWQRALLSEAIRLAQALDAVGNHRLAGRADVSRRPICHRSQQYTQGLVNFNAAGGCIFSALLCLRPAHPPPNPPRFPRWSDPHPAGSGRAKDGLILDTLGRLG